MLSVAYNYFSPLRAGRCAKLSAIALSLGNASDSERSVRREQLRMDRSHEKWQQRNERESFFI